MSKVSEISAPIVDFNTDAARRHRRLRAIKDRLARWGVAVGGISVIVAILLIFLYLLYEVLPLFKNSEVEHLSSYPIPHVVEGTETLYMAIEEQSELALRLDNLGNLIFFNVKDGRIKQQVSLPIPAGAKITALAEADPNSREVAVGFSDGGVIVFKHSYRLTYPDDIREITPLIEFPYGETPIILSESGH